MQDEYSRIDSACIAYVYDIYTYITNKCNIIHMYLDEYTTKLLSYIDE